MTATLEALTEAQELISTEWLEDIRFASDMGADLANQSELANTPEGLLVLTHVLATATLMRYPLRDPGRCAQLFQPLPGGTSYNQHRLIDVLPGILSNTLLETETDITFWNEEFGFTQRGTDPRRRLGFFDAIDGTSNIGIGQQDQACGIVLCDRYGKLIAGGTGSLTHNTILFIEANRKPYVLSYDDTMHTLTHVDTTQFSVYKERNDMRYGTLRRRLKGQTGNNMLQSLQYPTLTTFGGYGILMMVEGKLDAMIDIQGQKSYEAIIWYSLAQAYGLCVTKPDGSPIRVNEIIHSFVNEGVEEQTPVVIARTESAYNTIIAANL